MRNRNMPAGAYAGQHVGDGSDIGATGLTKREAAAIAAMQGMLALGWKSSEQFRTGDDRFVMPEHVARSAVAFADALFDKLEEETDTLLEEMEKEADALRDEIEKGEE